MLTLTSQPAEGCDITSRLKLFVCSPIWILCVRWQIINYLHLYLYYTSDKPSIYSIWCQIYGYENSSPLFSLLFLSFIQKGIGYYFASSLLFCSPSTQMLTPLCILWNGKNKTLLFFSLLLQTKIMVRLQDVIFNYNTFIIDFGT